MNIPDFKKFLAKRKILIGGSLLAIIVIILITVKEDKANSDLLYIVAKGKFEITVTSTGELRAKNQTNITAPSGLRGINIWQIKITDLVPEGSIVKEGDVVAQLDKSEIMTKVSEAQLNLQKKQSEFTQTRLDTTLTLREAREDLTNIKYSLEEKKLIKQQSIYEAPAVIQQVELDYEKALRSYEEKQKNYKTKVEQSATKMEIVGSDLSKVQNQLNSLMEVIQQLTVKAPKGGMVIYDKEWDGKKKTIGSMVNSWDPTLAALPDLTEMETVTYINEVDIQKIKMGQKVNVGLDAMPNKKLQGVVKSVANIGEQKPNSDAKVFEVIINILTKDSTLRPSMTTSCEIMSERYENVLSIPLESINTDNKISYVFKKDGSSIVKQEIKIFTTNETNALVNNGLNEGEIVCESTPKDTVGLAFLLLDKTKEITPKQLNTIDEKYLKQLKEEEAKGRKNNNSEEGDGGITIEIDE